VCIPRALFARIEQHPAAQMRAAEAAARTGTKRNKKNGGTKRRY